MKFFSLRKSRKLMKWPCSLGHFQYTKCSLRAMSCAKVRLDLHNGHLSRTANVGLGAEECSPMYFINCSVDAEVSPNSSWRLNQKAWHGGQTSIVNWFPSRAASFQSVIGIAQLGQFTAFDLFWAEYSRHNNPTQRFSWNLCRKQKARPQTAGRAPNFHFYFPIS